MNQITDPDQAERLLKVHVHGMGCRHCVREVSQWLRDVPGVRTVSADVRTSVVTLGGTMRGHDVLAALSASGYVGELVDEARTKPQITRNRTGAT